MEKFYPLKLEPQLKEKVWGGRWLVEQLGRNAGIDARLGESWEAFSGSQITNGAWKNRTLGELYNEYGSQLAGKVAAVYPQFPLLVKFIDARENLSVQVHPDDALAQKLENYPFGKSEMWYVMAAEPEARILYSLNDKAASLDELGEALQNERIVEYVQSVAVQAGDVVYLPARTVHALCEGIVVYELQQESDITYRLYDWGRTGREIHHAKGLQAISLEQRNLQVQHPQLQTHNGYAAASLLETPFFTCELLEIKAAGSRPSQPDSFTLVSVLEGGGQVVANNNQFETEPLATGDTYFLPCNLEYTLQATNGPLKVILGQAR